MYDFYLLFDESTEYLSNFHSYILDLQEDYITTLNSLQKYFIESLEQKSWEQSLFFGVF